MRLYDGASSYSGCIQRAPPCRRRSGSSAPSAQAALRCVPTVIVPSNQLWSVSWNQEPTAEAISPRHRPQRPRPAGPGATPPVWKDRSLEAYRSAIETTYRRAGKKQLALDAARVPFTHYLNQLHTRVHPIFGDTFLPSLDALPSDHPLNKPDLSTVVEVVLNQPTARSSAWVCSRAAASRPSTLPRSSPSPELARGPAPSGDRVTHRRGVLHLGILPKSPVCLLTRLCPTLHSERPSRRATGTLKGETPRQRVLACLPDA